MQKILILNERKKTNMSTCLINSDFLRFVIKANGDTISSLAKKMNLSRSTVSRKINIGDNLRIDDLEFFINEYNLDSKLFLESLIILPNQ